MYRAEFGYRFRDGEPDSICVPDRTNVISRSDTRCKDCNALLSSICVVEMCCDHARDAFREWTEQNEHVFSVAFDD